MVARAQDATATDVEFSPMDATRSDWTYLYEVLEAVIEAGATTLNIADTCGYASPTSSATLITRHPRARRATSTRRSISVHCHDDLGLAVANSLAAIKAGRAPGRVLHQRHRRAGRQRRARRDRHGADTCGATHHRVEHGINTRRALPTSALLQQFTGIGVQPNKAVVGANAFAHESGHPPGRHAQGRAHLRDHVRRGRSALTARAGAGQALRAARAAEPARGARPAADPGRAEPRVRRLQEPGRLAEGAHRRRPRPDRPPRPTSGRWRHGRPGARLSLAQKVPSSTLGSRLGRLLPQGSAVHVGFRRRRLLPQDSPAALCFPRGVPPAAVAPAGFAFRRCAAREGFRLRRSLPLGSPFGAVLPASGSACGGLLPAGFAFGGVLPGGACGGCSRRVCLRPVLPAGVATRRAGVSGLRSSGGACQ